MNTRYVITVGCPLSGLLYSGVYRPLLACHKNPLALLWLLGMALPPQHKHCLPASCSEAVEDTISSANNKEATDLSYSSLFTLL